MLAHAWEAGSVMAETGDRPASEEWIDYDRLIVDAAYRHRVIERLRAEAALRRRPPGPAPEPV